MNPKKHDISSVIPSCNRFEAILILSKQARNLHEKYDGLVSDCECLNCVINDEPPKDIDRKRKKRKEKLDRIWNVDEYITIDDPEIKEAVELSIHQSRLEKHLIYECNDLDNYKSSRVRVICNILWDKILKSDRSPLDV